MKKIIPVIAILGSVAAFAVYKMKKDEQKEIVDLDQGLMTDDDLDTADETMEEGPISDPLSCCMEESKEAIKDVVEDVKDVAVDAFDKAEKLACDTADSTKEMIDEFDFDFPYVLMKDVKQLKEKAKGIMDKMLEEGDVHTNERPVQHKVCFQTQEDLDNFKNSVINKGYVITKGDDALSLIVLHITPMSEQKVISNVLYLVNEAKANHGEYLGWTSKVVY